MNFDTTYLLEEFRAIQPELFDESGKAYRMVNAHGVAEQMLKLINQMEQEIIDLQTKLAETYI
jgi:hypothetical protein